MLALDYFWTEYANRQGYYNDSTMKALNDQFRQMCLKKYSKGNTNNKPFSMLRSTLYAALWPTVFIR